MCGRTGALVQVPAHVVRTPEKAYITRAREKAHLASIEPATSLMTIAGPATMGGPYTIGARERAMIAESEPTWLVNQSARAVSRRYTTRVREKPHLASAEPTIAATTMDEPATIAKAPIVRKTATKSTPNVRTRRAA